MDIDMQLIEYLEELSYITLSEDEKIRMMSDLENILQYISTLQEIDTANVPERSHPFDDTNAFREDMVCDSFDRMQILKNAPCKGENAFEVPKIID